MKAKVRCFFCRTDFRETKGQFEIVYDFCPTCEGGILRNFERDMLGMLPLPFISEAVQPPKKVRIEKPPVK